MIIKLSIFWKYEVLVMYKGKLLTIQLLIIGFLVNYFTDHDFIGVGLGGMGYSCRLYKKIISNCKFIRGWLQTGIFKKKNILLVVMFQNVLMDFKILKIFFFKNVFWNFCVILMFKKNLCVFPISYEYVEIISRD